MEEVGGGREEIILIALSRRNSSLHKEIGLISSNTNQIHLI